MALRGQPVREFLCLGERERGPDHSWLSRTRSRLSLEVHDQVFGWVLKRLAEHGLIKGERIGVDASTIEANAALRTITRRDSGEGYREMLTRMAQWLTGLFRKPSCPCLRLYAEGWQYREQTGVSSC